MRSVGLTSDGERDDEAASRGAEMAPMMKKKTDVNTRTRNTDDDRDVLARQKVVCVFRLRKSDLFCRCADLRIYSVGAVTSTSGVNGAAVVPEHMLGCEQRRDSFVQIFLLGKLNED
ncbi:uncharacterized [Tachysurus ichikawai]